MARRSFAVVGLSTLLFCSFSAHAVDRTWIRQDEGDFQEGSNWSPIGSPQAADRLTINTGTVSVGGGLGGYFGRCTDATVGDTAGSNGAIHVISGVMSPGGSGLLTSGHVILGNGGSGIATVSGGRARLDAQTMSLGAMPGGSGTLTVPHIPYAHASVSQNLYIGGSPAGPGGAGFVSAFGISVQGEMVIYGGGRIGITTDYRSVNGSSLTNVRQEGGHFANFTGDFSADGLSISGLYQMNGGSAALQRVFVDRMRISGGQINVVKQSSVTRDLVVAPRAGSTTPAVLNLTGQGELVVGGNLHVGGDASGPLGPAILRSGDKARGAATASVFIHPQGVLAETDPLNFPGGITNCGTVQPNEDGVGQLQIGAGGLRLLDGGRFEVSIHGVNAADSIVTAGGAIQIDGLLTAYFPSQSTSTIGQDFLVVSAPYTGRFDNVGDIVIAGARQFQIAYSANQVRLVDVGVVPEPSWSIVAFVVVFFGRWRLRRG